MFSVEIKLDGYGGKCDCGREHKLLTRTIVIDTDATKKLGDIVHALGLSSGGRLICDTNTRRYADAIADNFSSILCPTKPVITLDAKNLHANEIAVAELLDTLPDDTQWLIAVGSGTIHDLTRYLARERKLQFISYPTACSADAFASTVCAMTFKGMKKTFSGPAPLAIIADTAVYLAAPYRLTASGISDILGKYTCLADWQCGRLMLNEDFCERIYAISKKSLDEVRENLPAIHAGDKDAYETLMLALILSGIAMQLWGDSRPASGSEHHLSHFWEMGIINPKLTTLHGEQVGVGLLLALRHYDQIGQLYNIERTIKPYEGMPLALMRKKLGPMYEDILKQNQPDLLRNVTTEKVVETFAELQKILKALPKAGKLRPFMQAAGCVTTLEELGLTREIIPESIILSPFVRRRMTIMRYSKLLPL